MATRNYILKINIREKKLKSFRILPARRVGISGRVKRIGRRKISPTTKLMGIDHDNARGSWTAGLCTSSAMLATLIPWVSARTQEVNTGEID